MVVQGHLSIVNSTLIHPVLPLIATAGIERQVVLHSPTPNTPWATNLPITPTATRSLPSDGLGMTDPSSLLRLLIRMNTFMEPDESLGEDARSIAYFDMYVSFLVFPLMATKPVVAGFCSGRVKGTYLRYDTRRWRRMTTRTTMGTILR
jgi:hypothetical protein